LERLTGIVEKKLDKLWDIIYMHNRSERFGFGEKEGKSTNYFSRRKLKG